MSNARRYVIAIATLLLSAQAANAQLPVATGRQIDLSRSQWKLFVPDDYTSDGNQVDLLVHFHGNSQTVWNNAAYANLNAVIVTVNYSGLSSAYSNPFADTTLFQQLLDDAQSTLAVQPDFGSNTAWDHLAVSSFSAGYGAVRSILRTPTYFEAIDSLLAADSLYATTSSDGTALNSQMADYKAFASRAAAGDKRFIFTHSEVPTFTYESTAETGDELLQHLNLTPQASDAEGLGPLRFYREAEQGNFKLWGARGADGEGHLNHLRYLGEWLDDLGFSATQPRLPADFNGDGTVDAADYTVWRDNFLTFTSQGDADGSGYVNLLDYQIWADDYGDRVAEPTTAVPEPASVIGVALVWGTLVAKTRRCPA